MKKSIISLFLIFACAATAWAADPRDLKDDAPERYVVREGDTLWSIAGRYLKQPWRWPELWKMNQSQVRNPHRIYPGDVLVLEHRDQRAQLRVVKLDTVKLSPRTRTEQLSAKPIPGIAPSAIEPFLSKPLVVGATELDDKPRIVATEESRVAVGTGNIAYASGLTKDKGIAWQVFRRGDPLVDPETRQILGYVATYLGDARVRNFGEISTIEITRSNQEIYRDDRLIPVTREAVTFSYVPHAPQKPVRAHILSAYANLSETGPLSIVALSKGSADGLEIGHVLAIHRNQANAQNNHRTAPLYGRSGITGNAALHDYRGTQLTPRDAPLYARADRAADQAAPLLPDERYGLVMVFRTFDRASFGLVMQAARPVAVSDVVTNP